MGPRSSRRAICFDRRMSQKRWSWRDTLRLLTGAAAGRMVAPAQTARPNILLVYADDLRWGDVSIIGRKGWPTHTLDWLAREGTVFSHWYSGAPLGVPS